MAAAHLPSLGVFLLTLLTQRPCINFPRSRAADLLYPGSKGQARAGAGAPVGCTELDAGRGEHTPCLVGCSRQSPRTGGKLRASGSLTGTWPGSRAREGCTRWESTRGHPCPTFTLCLLLTVRYSSCRLPQGFSDSVKLSSVLPSSAGDSKNSFVSKQGQKKASTH